MRAPVRIIGISLAAFLAITFLLSSFESDTVTRTINKFPNIKQQWQARAAAMQSHFSSKGSSTSSNAAACDADEKSCSAPYMSKDSDKQKKPIKDQTPSEYDSTDSKDSKDKDGKRPSTKDEDRDKDRGFTDAEQAAALERLEFKYGAEAKADTDKVLWMETTTTTAWGADPTEELNAEEEKARKMLGEEYGDLKKTTTADDAEATPKEKGWRTTGFETRAKTTQKTLVDGGGGNGTATPTASTEISEPSDFEIVAETGTRKGKKPAKTTVDEAMITSNPKGAKPTKKPVPDEEELEEYAYLDEEVTTTKKESTKGKKPLWAADDDDFVTSTKKGKKPAAPTEDADEEEATATSTLRWDD